MPTLVFIVAPIATAVLAAVAWAQGDAMDKLWLLIWFYFAGIVAATGGLAWLIAWLVHRSNRVVRDAEQEIESEQVGDGR